MLYPRSCSLVTPEEYLNHKIAIMQAGTAITKESHELLKFREELEKVADLRPGSMNNSMRRNLSIKGMLSDAHTDERAFR